MHLAENALLDLCTRGCVISLYFSIKRAGVLNFTRPRGLLAQHGVRLNTVGKTNLFPPEVQAALAKAEELTKDNQKWVPCLRTSSYLPNNELLFQSSTQLVHAVFFAGRDCHGCRGNDSCCLTGRKNRVSLARMQRSVYADNVQTDYRKGHRRPPDDRESQ